VIKSRRKRKGQENRRDSLPPNQFNGTQLRIRTEVEFGFKKKKGSEELNPCSLYLFQEEVVSPSSIRYRRCMVSKSDLGSESVDRLIGGLLVHGRFASSHRRNYKTSDTITGSDGIKPPR
jgi:hypothetical protein